MHFHIMGCLGILNFADLWYADHMSYVKFLFDFIPLHENGITSIVSKMLQDAVNAHLAERMSKHVRDGFSDLPAILRRAGSWNLRVPKFHHLPPF